MKSKTWLFKPNYFHKATLACRLALKRGAFWPYSALLV